MGFTDPLHPPIVHIPIGLVIGALVLFVVALVYRRERLILTARHLSILALVFVFPTILLGVFDWIHFYRGALISAIIIKMVLAGALLVLLGIGIILGGEAKVYRAALSLVYICSFALVVALGYFGASLVYGHGAAQAPSSSIGLSGSPPPAPSPSSSAFGKGGEGETLFESNCASCHPGGGNVVEPRLPIRGSGKLASLEGFRAFLRAPRMPDGKAGNMPAFGESALSADHVEDLYAYLRTEFE